MTPQQYSDWGDQYWRNTNPELGEMHAVLGIGSESGELQDLFKKRLAKGTEVTRDAVLDETSDILYYIARLLKFHNSSFEEAFERNRVKLDYRMAFGKNKEKELELQKMVSIPLSEPTEQGVMRYA